MALDKLLGQLLDFATKPDMVFRGQPCSIPKGKDTLFSSLDRIGINVKIAKDRLLRIENDSWEAFQQRGYSNLAFHDLTLWNDLFYRWMLMRHLGIPTRLLDWTQSGWIAAYFASCSEWGEDGVIYAFDGREFDRCNHQANMAETHFALDERKGRPRVMVDQLGTWVCRLMRRGPVLPNMVAQQGLFTYGAALCVDHWSAIERVMRAAPIESRPIKITVSRRIKAGMLHRLDNMGINAATLFPGIVGVAWHIRDRIESISQAQFCGRPLSIRSRGANA